MWIWYVSRSSGGNPTTIAQTARANGVQTLFVKAGDGDTYWSQFSSRLVYFIHRNGVHVCAWQYVYGRDPVGEARIGADAVHAGADCLVIDAEAEYEGHYAAAQTYIDTLRSLVGRHYPIGLASFPYVDYHPAFPYSVFFGYGGAQFDLPQMYWHDIGTSVGAVYQHTYMTNSIYRRWILPLGQTDTTSAGDIELFRGYSVAYRSRGLSWWDYAWTSANNLWGAISGPYTPVSSMSAGVPILAYGSQGDDVLWMQELLKSAIPSQRTTGNFANQTEGNVRAFQARHGIPTTGQVGPQTWHALMRLPLSRVNWAAADASAARGRGHRGPREPENARLRAKRYEIHPPSGPDG
jgi:hypothetical protein